MFGSLASTLNPSSINRPHSSWITLFDENDTAILCSTTIYGQECKSAGQKRPEIGPYN
jgi:hypothetical protein